MKGKTYLIRALWSSLFFILLGGSLIACETVTSATHEETTTEEHNTPATLISLQEMASAIASDVDASPQDLQNALSDHQPRWGQPGILWYVAATLQERLTPEQKERLLRRAHRLAQKAQRERRAQLRKFFSRPAHRLPVWRILTDDQRPAFRELWQRYRQAFRTLAEQLRTEAISREEFLRQALALREAFREELDNLLTDEQKQRLEERRDARQERREERMDAIRDAMIEALGLTPEQVEALESLHETQKETRRELFEQFKNGDLTLEQLKEALQALREQRQQTLEEILTPEQLETFKIHRALVIRFQYFRKHHRRHHG